MVGSRTGLGSGLVWLESVGNKWTEQGLFLQGPPPPSPTGLGSLSSSQALGTWGHFPQPFPKAPVFC